MRQVIQKVLAVLCLGAGAISGVAGAQGNGDGLPGSWQGALRCGKVRVQAHLELSGNQNAVQGLLRATRVEGTLPPGASALLSPIQLQGQLRGNEIVFTSTGAGGTFPLLKATLKPGGVLAGTLPPQTGCSSLYFVRTTAYAEASPTGPVPSPLPLPADASDASGLTGVWVGKYICQQGVTGVLMAIQGRADGRLQVRFSFYPLPENPFVPSGTVDVQGLLQGTHLTAQQYVWVSHPAGFGFEAGGILSVSDDSSSVMIIPDAQSGCLKLEATRQP
jgi:hypothetical protein